MHGVAPETATLPVAVYLLDPARAVLRQKRSGLGERRLGLRPLHCGDFPYLHAEEKRVGVIDLFQPRREDFIAKYAIARRSEAPKQFREVKEVFLSTMLIIHEGDDLEQHDLRVEHSPRA